MDALTTYLESILGYDFRIMWEAGRALIEGSSPFEVPGFFYPMPFAIFVSLFSLVPFRIAHVLMIVLSLAAFRRLKPPRNAYLFAPIPYGLFMGQFDLLFISLGLRGGPLGLILSFLKPQVGIWLAIYKFYGWRKEDRAAIFQTLAGILLLYLVPALLFPGWVQAWWAASPGILDYASHSSSLFGVGRLVPLPWLTSVAAVGIIVLLGAVYLAARRRLWPDYWPYVTLVNPFSHEYFYAVLFRHADRLLAVLSWPVLFFRFATGSGLVMTILPLVILLRERFPKTPRFRRARAAREERHGTPQEG